MKDLTVFEFTINFEVHTKYVIGEKESDEDIVNKVLSGMSEETKDIIIKEMIKGENCSISIVAVPVCETVCRTNGISTQQIVDIKYSVTVISKDGRVIL